ncbi:MAG: hypothetical protein HQK59_17425 [Deltaproteobacteria bacterium]|nr:hypothetical protein [Deltaproteobacteria bacterium]
MGSSPTPRPDRFFNDLVRQPIKPANRPGKEFRRSADVCRYNIKKTGYQNRIVELPNVLSSAPFSLGTGRNSTYSHILPQVDQTIRQMRGDGTLHQIYDKYK